MVQPSDLAGIGENTTLTILDDGVITPGIPMRQHHFQEFISAVVAQIMFQMIIRAHIMRFTIIQRCHHIPGRAPAQHVIQCRENPRHMEGFVIGGGIGAAEPKLGCSKPHRRQDRNQIKLHHANAIAHRFRMVMAKDIGHGEPVIEKRHVKATGFKRAGDALVILRAEIILHGRGMTPGAHIIRAILRLQKGNQRHLLHWRIPFSRSASSRRGDGAASQSAWALR